MYDLSEKMAAAATSSQRKHHAYQDSGDLQNLEENFRKGDRGERMPETGQERQDSFRKIELEPENAGC